MNLKLKKGGALMPIALERQRRRWARFHPDMSTEASIDIKLKRGKYKATHNAIVLDEAFKGCCLVVGGPFELTAGDTLWCKVGQVGPLKGEIHWIKKLDTRVYKLGVFFLG